jgi:polysaccharide export outer membrane protein
MTASDTGYMLPGWGAGALRTLSFLLLLLLGLLGPVAAQTDETIVPPPAYRVQPGDVLMVSVWKEPELQREVLVPPDGVFSMPLAGQVQAVGRTVADIEKEIGARIARYIPEPVVSVALGRVQGNKVHVVGKVARPGEYVMTGEVDVMQALAMAGGTTPFADLNDIVVLRRQPDRSQVSIPFRYTEVEAGESLEQNIILRSGDVVVVP